MDNTGNPVLSFAADAMLHTVSVNEGRRRPMKWQGQLGEGESTVEAANLKDEVPYLDGRMRKKSARNTFTEAGRIVHHILWQYRTPSERAWFTLRGSQGSGDGPSCLPASA
jgi:hypothetical protein